MNDKRFIDTIAFLVKQIIDTKSSVKKIIREKKKPLFRFQFRNKSFHTLLVRDLSILAGKKSDNVRIPKKIMMKPELYPFVLAGLYNTDGGSRGNTIGFCSANKLLIKDIKDNLQKIPIESSQDSWINKKYAKEYFGIRIKKNDIDKFIRRTPIISNTKLKRAMLLAGMPEWSNGTDNSFLELVHA